MVDKEKAAKYVQDITTYLKHLAELKKYSLENYLSERFTCIYKKTRISLVSL